MDIFIFQKMVVFSILFFSFCFLLTKSCPQYTADHRWSRLRKCFKKQTNKQKFQHFDKMDIFVIFFAKFFHFIIFFLILTFLMKFITAAGSL